MISFGVVGGDRRQLYLARALAGKGYPVFLCGLDQLEDGEAFSQLSLGELSQRCQAALLPLPVTRDGNTLNAPFSSRTIPLDGGFAQSLRECTVLGGMVEPLRRTIDLWQEIPLEDYYRREELTLGNAFLTAEAAVALAVERSPGALGGSRCLVTGFGRIGKALCQDLRGLGAQVDCCARKPWDLTAIRALGCGALSYDAAPQAYDFIFNTVPAQVVGERLLSFQTGDTLVLELASAPGGIDRQAAKRWGVQVVDAPSLPGRFSPKASGELIAEAVIHILEERRRLL